MKPANQLIPIIYRGDDTGFNDDSRLLVRIDTDIQMAGRKVEVIFQGLRKIYTAVDNDTPIRIDYSARQTASFKAGVYRMDIRVRDEKRRVMTLMPRLCIVTDLVREVEKWRGSCAEAETSISVLSEQDIFDCGVTFHDLKERIAYLWEKLGGSAENMSVENIVEGKKALLRIWKRYGGKVTNEGELEV